MSGDPRRRLAEAEAALLRALVADGAIPEGFDPAGLQAASDALVRKRTRLAAKLWPTLSGALGAAFASRFAAYAARHPLRDAGGALADGLLFASEAVTSAELTDPIRLERLRAQAHLVCRAGRVTPRRWPALKLSWLRQSHGLAILLTVPGRHPRLLVLALPL